MPFAFGGTGTGGSGFSLGPVQNEFATDALRNTYATANATWLAQYNGNRAFWIRVGGAAGAIQRRNSAGTGWEDVTGIVSGRDGVGRQGRFEISIHTNSAAQPTPSTPTGGTYNLVTGAFTPPAGTTEDPTPPGTGEDIWLSQAEIDPEIQTGTVTPIWSEWVERSHLSSGISHVEHSPEFGGAGITGDPLTLDASIARDTELPSTVTAGDLTGTGRPAAPLALDDARKFEANPAAAYTENLLKLQLGATVYDVDELVDVTNTGLPALVALNYQKLFVDHDTPRVWVGHREVQQGTPAQGTFGIFTMPPTFLNAQASDPVGGLQIGYFYYNTTRHVWRRYVPIFMGIGRWRDTAITVVLGSTARWLGEQPDDPTAVGLVDNFDTNLQYYFFHITNPGIELLNNSTYVAGVQRSFHYLAEPISAPSGVSGITGVTAGRRSHRRRNVRRGDAERRRRGRGDPAGSTDGRRPPERHIATPDRRCD